MEKQSRIKMPNDWRAEKIKIDSMAQRLEREKEDLNSLVRKLSRENEYHLENIEKLKKQVELYKSKSTFEVDRKLAVLETEARKEAHRFKLENERLTELISFNEIKTKEKQQEIDKLRLVIRAEAEADRFPSTSAVKKISPRKIGNLEKR